MNDRSNSVPETVWERWQENAARFPTRDAVIHWVAGDEPFRWTFASLIDAAESLARSLSKQGIRKGNVCAIILRHNRHLYPLYAAICSLGAIPAVLAYPNPRLHPEKFRQGLQGMAQRSGLDWILTERELQPVIEPLVSTSNSTIKGIRYPLNGELREDVATRPRQVNDSTSHGIGSQPLLLQHSSGTTGLQKPVLLSNSAVLEHVRRYSRAISLSESDKIVSWLPLYHDMGLIAAFHLPLAFGIPTVQIDPFEWVLAPSLLLEAVTKERGTVSWLPNFAYSMMADKIADQDLAGIDLSTWRMLINCSEPIRQESHEKVLSRLRLYGLRASSLSCCYAMAEATFAVTQSKPACSPTYIRVDRNELSRGKVVLARDGVPARTCVSSGVPIDGCEVRILNEQMQELEDGAVGEIVLSSTSLFEGYRNYPEKTAEVLRNGWYYSGDYGFRWHGELFVIGRKKDIIIVAGNNIYPEDIEDAIGVVDGVLPGRVVAFGEENARLGSEQVAVIAETAITDGSGQRHLRFKILEAGMAINVTISSVYLVPPRWLIKSSAGKPSRKANRERVAELSCLAEVSTE